MDLMVFSLVMASFIVAQVYYFLATFYPRAVDNTITGWGVN